MGFSFRYLVAALFMTLAYYFSATQLFPRDRSPVKSLDEHSFKHRHDHHGFGREITQGRRHRAGC